MNKFIYKPNLSLREIRDIQSGEFEKRAAYIEELEKQNKIRKQSAREDAIEKQNFYDQVRYDFDRHIKGLWQS